VVAADLSTPGRRGEAVTETLNAHGRIGRSRELRGSRLYQLASRRARVSDGSRGTNTTRKKWREVNGESTSTVCLHVPLVIPQMKQQKGWIDRDRHQHFRASGGPRLRILHRRQGAAINLNALDPIPLIAGRRSRQLHRAGFPSRRRWWRRCWACSTIRRWPDRVLPDEAPGTAEEMAYACLYFASDESTYCQGSVLVIDGGTTARNRGVAVAVSL